MSPRFDSTTVPIPPRGLSARAAWLLVAAASMLAGCDRASNTVDKPATPVVAVAEVVTRDVAHRAEFIGSTEAVRSVTVRARVTGFLHKRLFAEGGVVKQGELLYMIDPAEFQTRLTSAEGDMAKSRAALAKLDADLKRYQLLRHKQDVAQQTLDSVTAQHKEAQAQVETDQAAVAQAQLNLDYTRVYAPLGGRIGDTRVNVGNLVGPDQNAELATIVQLDPIYVMFRPGGAELNAIVRQQRDAPVEVTVTLPDGTDQPHRGAVDFIDNRVDPATGTLRMRAVIANPDGALRPGQFARVGIELGKRADTAVVPQTALVENQGGFLLYVVGDDDSVQVRNVEVGELFDGVRAVTSGVKAGERVIVSGVQQVRAGMKVEVKAAGAKPAGQPAAKPASKPAA